jgi:microcompartment protein CcmL/EutN
LAADAGIKAADVTLPAIRLADDLGGKAYCLFSGAVADVEAAVEGAVAVTDPAGKLVGTAVIPQLHHEMRDNLAAALRFNHHLQRRPGSS